MEHHFLEGYSHCSAPEVFLTAVAAQTRRIRVGHGAVVCVPEMNHPVRVAERAAALDLISNGRLELGTARSSTWTELGGFEVNPDDTKITWRRLEYDNEQTAYHELVHVFAERFPKAGEETRNLFSAEGLANALLIPFFLARSMKNAQTSGTMMKARFEAPKRCVTADMLAIAVGVEPREIPPKPEHTTAAS